MTVTEKETLVLAIDLQTSVFNNDLETTKNIVEILNNTDNLNENIRSIINEGFSGSLLSEVYAKSEAYEYVLNNLIHIVDKNHKENLLELMKVMHTDRESIKMWLEQNAVLMLNNSADNHNLEIAKMLIRMCFHSQDFVTMERLRNELKEA